MTGSNLPPGVTPSDIDKHFGTPERVRVIGDVVVGASAEIYKDATDEEMEQALIDAVSDGNIEDIIRATVHEVERQ